MAKTLAPSVTHRDPKGRKLVSIVETAYDKAELSEEEAQRVNNTPGLSDLVSNFIAENRLTDKFKDEEVVSSYGYLSGYKPKGITELINRLRELLPSVGFADEKIAEGELPANAEAWFAIPRWQSVAPTYSEAVQKVLDLLNKTRGGNFYNYREGQLGPGYLRQSERSVAFWEKTGKEQEGHDILVIPAQFGIRHRGRSVRRALEVMSSGEFGLGAFAIGIMLLTHPERIQNVDDLWIDCAGDEYSFGADGRFEGAPYFSFFVGRLELDTSRVGNADGDYGSASAFVSVVSASSS